MDEIEVGFMLEMKGRNGRDWERGIGDGGRVVFGVGMGVGRTNKPHAKDHDKSTFQTLI